MAYKTKGEFRSVEKLLKVLFLSENEETVSFKVDATSKYLKDYHLDTNEIILTQKMISSTEKNVYVEFKKEKESSKDFSFCFLQSYEYPIIEKKNYSRAFKIDFLKEIIYVYSKETFEVITNYCKEDIKSLFPIFYFLSEKVPISNPKTRFFPNF